MSEPTKNNPLVVHLTADELRAIIREEIERGNGKPLAQKEWLKATELAELYGLPKTFFEERGRAGEIERTKPGKYVLFKRRDVEAYMEKHKNKN